MHTSVKDIEKNMGRWGQAVGGVAAILGGLMKVTDSAKELQRIQNQMITGGWTQKEVAEATAKSWELTAKYQSIGVEKVMEMQKEMAPVLGSRTHAMEIAEIMANLEVNLQGVLGEEKAASYSSQIRDAVRSGEMSGNAMQPERFAKFMDQMGKVMNAFGGTITPHDFLNTCKFGRAASLNWSDDFVSNVLPTIMQQQGTGTGNAFMGLYQATVGGHMTPRSMNEFARLGLIDQSKVDPEDYTKYGQLKRMRADYMKGSDMLMSNPYEWTKQYEIPALLKAGIISQAGLDEIAKGNVKEGLGAETRQAISKEFAILWSNRVVQGTMDVMAIEQAKIERDKKLLGQSMGNEEGANYMLQKDYIMQQQSFGEQWHAFVVALGDPMIGTATRMLKSLNSSLSGMATWSAANPGKIKVIAALMAALGAAMIAAGTVMVGGAILGMVGTLPLITAGLTGLAAALGMLMATGWFEDPALAKPFGGTLPHGPSAHSPWQDGAKTYDPRTRQVVSGPMTGGEQNPPLARSSWLLTDDFLATSIC